MVAEDRFRRKSRQPRWCAPLRLDTSGGLLTWSGRFSPRTDLGSGSRAPSAAVFRCTTSRHKTHRTEAGGYDAVVGWRWHRWSGRTVHVHEVLDRRGEVSARCSPGDGSGVQEMPFWMLDAAACSAMRTTAAPEASASALADLRALLSDALATLTITDEASGRARMGFGDRHDGDRHAAPATPLIATRVVREGPSASAAGNAVGDSAPGQDAARADRARDADADGPRQRPSDGVGGSRR